MSNIEFEGENATSSNSHLLYARIQASNRAPKLVDFLIRHKIVKNESQANAIILILVVVAIVFSIFFFGKFASGPLKITEDAITRTVFYGSH